MKKYLLLILLFLSLTATGQNLHLEVWHDGNTEIRLRWTPIDRQVFFDGTQQGYRLVRYTVQRNGKELKTPETRFLIQTPLKPISHAQFKAMEGNMYADMAGDLLYDSKAAEGESQEEADTYRYIYSLFSANMSYKVAEGLALAFTDKTARKNERYIYELSMAGSPNQKAQIMTGLNMRILEAVPSDVSLLYRDSTATLRFDIGNYMAYNLERSDDEGVTYNRLNTEPILATYEEGDTTSYTMIHDRVPELYKNYYYRIKAITSFENESLPSLPVKIFAYQTNLPAPQDVSSRFLTDKALLSWDYPDSLVVNLSGFKVYHRSSLGDSVGRLLTPKPLPYTQRSYLDTTTVTAGFYQVSLLDLQGFETASSPLYVGREDSIPPFAPVILSDTVTKEGVVTINWKLNKERDLYGYRIYRANTREGIYDLISGDIKKDTVMTDTIPLRILNKNVFYAIVALDNHLNASIQNDTVVIKRPDIIPPIPPKIERFLVTDSTINLYWSPSTSEDVTETRLWRNLLSDTVRTLLVAYPPDKPVTQWSDTTAIENIAYQYTLEAVDDSGNSSGDESSIKLKIKSPQYRKAIVIRSQEYDRKAPGILLNWKHAPTRHPVKNYVIYRRTDGGPLNEYKTIATNQTAFLDDNVKDNTAYSYAVVAYLTDGSETWPQETTPLKTPKSK